MISAYQFKGEVFARAIHYLIGSDLTMAEAKAKAAREIAAEYRVKAAREKRHVTMPAPAPADASIESELAGAKERFFNKLSVYFSAFDRHAAEDRKRERAAKRAAKVQRVKLIKKSPELTQPDPEPSNIYSFPLVYTSGVHSVNHISDEGYHARLQDRTTANWRASIAEAKKREQS